MTEEIINGINVAKCEFFDNYECNIYVNEYWEPQDNTKDMCKWHENCYYKQLKCLEQENKELKEKKDKYYQQTLDNEILMNELSLEVDLRKKESDFYLEKLSKYRSALEEIKSIIINDNSILIDKKDYFELQCGEPIAFKLQKIYNKINEVLDKG